MGDDTYEALLKSLEISTNNLLRWSIESKEKDESRAKKGYQEISDKKAKMQKL
jgi:hypothetical protein